jgi:hypothetical protein
MSGVGMLDFDSTGADLDPHAVAVDLDLNELTWRCPTLDGVRTNP